VVERSPEKAGVGGSTPSRGTIFSTKQTRGALALTFLTGILLFLPEAVRMRYSSPFLVKMLLLSLALAILLTICDGPSPS
jgi:hypothetical protein